MNILSIYNDKRLWPIFFLGISSGLPLLLTGSTLSVWLTEEGVSLETIGLFALVGLPYTLKFLWAPLFDRFRDYLRGFMLATQLALMGLFVVLASLSPAESPWLIATIACAIAFFSATQDIAIDAFRIRLFEEKSYGSSEAVVVFGYRVGMMLSGAFALYVATFSDWSWCFLTMAVLMLIGIITVLLTHSPPVGAPVDFSSKKSGESLAGLKSLLTRPTFLTILVIALFYKLGDAFVVNMTNPYLLSLGFTKIDIANATKVVGLIAMIIGGFLGGALIARFGIFSCLLGFGILGILSNLSLPLLSLTDANFELLLAIIGLESFVSGMSTAAFVAYLSSLCNKQFAASQYAFLSAIASLGRTLFSSLAGYWAVQTSWPSYFASSALLCLPALLLIVRMVHAKTSLPTTQDYADQNL